MAVPAKERPRFVLPTRIRIKHAPGESLWARLALADRIAQLPGVQTVEPDVPGLPVCVDIMISRSNTSSRKCCPPQLLCSISRDGIAVYGLQSWDKHQVLSRGWGQLKKDHVLLRLPRDEGELDVCWDILQRANHTLLEVLAGAKPVRIAWNDDLPKMSRTNLR